MQPNYNSVAPQYSNEIQSIKDGYGQQNVDNHSQIIEKRSSTFKSHKKS
jgi:hypothetical protein